MKTSKIALVAATLAGLATTAANADTLQFSFADPQPGRQLSNSGGLMTYDQNSTFQFLANLSAAGLSSNQTWNNAAMEMSLTLGAPVAIPGGYVAPVSGFFEVYDNTGSVRTNILRGTASDGAYVRVSNTNTMLFSDPGLVYTAGAALNGLLPIGQSFDLTNPQEASFTITDIQSDLGGNPINGGSFIGFTANASYSGNTEFRIVPTPGTAMLAGLGGLLTARRRRA